jgi:hypothetical protein
MSDLMIDIFSWSLHQHGQYIVYSLYLALINNGMTNMNKQLWRLKVEGSTKNQKFHVVFEKRGSSNKR